MTFCYGLLFLGTEERRTQECFAPTSRAQETEFSTHAVTLQAVSMRPLRSTSACDYSHALPEDKLARSWQRQLVYPEPQLQKLTIMVVVFRVKFGTWLCPPY